LARAFREGGVTLVGVHGRRQLPDDPFPVSTGALPATISDASVVLVTVQDSQLEPALAELEAAALAPGAVVLHASGSAYPIRALRRLRDLGHPVGTFHPLVPIPRPDRAPALMRGAWVGVDGDPEAVRAATALAVATGARVLAIPSQGRAAYHAAAVMASNFPTVLAGLAASLMNSVGVDETSARAAVRHLMRAAVTNLAEAEPDVALTGPITRGDVETVASHLAVLAASPALDAVYRALSLAAIPMAAAQGTDRADLHRIVDLLAAQSVPLTNAD
jgi:predicted short-subunit dehydrogenase-like oxidoreductase (DUF2520 family)